MIPEITIKISFAPAPGGVIEPTVAALDISPPEIPEGTSVSEIPPPLVANDDSFSSFAYDVPPPPAAMTVEDDVPPIPDNEGAENAFKEVKEPPPTPNKGGRGYKTK
jgi:hypothetical protein